MILHFSRFSFARYPYSLYIITCSTIKFIAKNVPFFFNLNTKEKVCHGLSAIIIIINRINDIAHKKYLLRLIQSYLSLIGHSYRLIDLSSATDAITLFRCGLYFTAHTYDIRE